jgi:cyclophilin family peptidyl-prolyl cis-trans isomerase
METERAESKKMMLMVGIGVAIVLAGTLYLIGKTEKVTANLEAVSDSRSLKGISDSAVLVTNFGDIEIKLLPSKAPNTVKNFKDLAARNFYNGTKFHRVIKNFMIQGGDPNSKGSDSSFYGRGGPGYTFADEINDQLMVRGKFAMANAGPNTNGSQFFIITAESTPWLQGKHTVFGEVTGGMDVVDKISSVQTAPGDLPMTPVIIEKIVLK